MECACPAYDGKTLRKRETTGGNYNYNKKIKIFLFCFRGYVITRYS